MELYKIELYKLIHRKFFLISLSGIFAVLLLFSSQTKRFHQL